MRRARLQSCLSCLSVDIYKSTVIIYGLYRSRRHSWALINFSAHTRTHTERVCVRPARVSSAHQVGHLISAKRPSSKLGWDIYNMQSSAVKNEMLQKMQMEIAMINSVRVRAWWKPTFGYDCARDCKSGSRKLRQVEVANSCLKSRQAATRWVGCCCCCLFNGSPAHGSDSHSA